MPKPKQRRNRILSNGRAILTSLVENDQAVDNTSWFQATYIDEIESIVALSHSGVIATISPGTGAATCVGVFDNGIMDASWSPDAELMVLLTREGPENNAVLIAMNTVFDIVAEVTVEPTVCPTNYESSRNKEHDVSICWKPDGQLLSVSSVDAYDNTRRMRIYKRDDMSLHAIGLSEDGSGRAVPNITPTSISWSGSGCSNVIAAVQATGSKSCKVIFFESNGLRHKEFALRNVNNKADTVTQLAWNVESDLLAVAITSSATQSSRVQLWHRNNYHWYMKYELEYHSYTLVRQMKFDLEKPYRLLVSLSSDKSHLIEWRTYHFTWDVHVSPVDKSFSTTVVVDGTSLLITPLGKAVVPPPMCACELTLNAPVVGVAFHPCPKVEVPIAMLTQLADGTLRLLGAQGKSAECMVANYSGPKVLATVAIASTPSDFENTSMAVDAARLRQIIVVGQENHLLHLLSVECSDGATTPECLVEIEIDVSTINVDSSTPVCLAASILNKIPLEGRVLRLTNWLNAAGKALVELADGSLLEYNLFVGGVVPSDCEPIMEPCPWISAMLLEDHEVASTRHDDDVVAHDERGHEKRSLIVGLSHRHRLYCGEQLLCSSASTFALSNEHKFVVYVSLGSRAQLHFIPVSCLASWDPLSGSEEFLLEGYEPRQVERGSRMVSVLSSAPNVILQMPRGNLEVVAPRALVLPFCMSLIDQKNYGRALDIMRRNKVDLNLLVDFHPMAFLNDVNLFLQQVTDVEQLNLFLSCLFNGDITVHKYQVPEWFCFQSPIDERSKSQFDFSNKVNTICQRMCQVMIDLEQANNVFQQGHFLLPILSSFAKESPPRLETALELIRDRAIETASAKGAPANKASRSSNFLSEKAQHSIQYLAFLADYELLFNTALGMYDYDLAKAVARNSQMDPKAYLPLLKRLGSLPDQALARYEVDMKLGRFELALKNLAECAFEPEQEKGHFDRCMNMIEQHQLHKLGLQLFASNKRMYHDIMVSLGERLFKEHKFTAALSVFLAVEPKDFAGAKKAARMCKDWRSYFACCVEHHRTENDGAADKEVIERSIAAEVADEIFNHASSAHGAEKREAISGAARILLDYCQDVEGAVDILISGQLWDEARRIALLCSKADLEERCIDAAESYAQSCTIDFEERAEAFETANHRYGEVLKIRHEAKRMSAELGEIIDDRGSVFSSASMMSNTSLQSNMSSSSIGSVTSISSVISAGATSTFTLSSHMDVNKHKSKFNQIGKDQRKQKKMGRKQKSRMKAGSEDELTSLVSALKQNCIWEDYLRSIAETISFLLRIGKLPVAQYLLQQYEDLRLRVDKSQTERIFKHNAEVEERKEDARRNNGTHEEGILIGCEKEVDELRCTNLPQDLLDLFDFFLHD